MGLIIFLIVVYLLSVCVEIYAAVIYCKELELKFLDLDTLDMILITCMTLFPLVNTIFAIFFLLTSSED